MHRLFLLRTRLFDQRRETSQLLIGKPPIRLIDKRRHHFFDTPAEKGLDEMGERMLRHFLWRVGGSVDIAQALLRMLELSLLLQNSQQGANSRGTGRIGQSR